MTGRPPKLSGVQTEKIYQIVGDQEADVKAGKISISSPIARALIGKTVGDSVEVQAPGGARGYEIDRWQIDLDDIRHLPGFSPVLGPYEDAVNVVASSNRYPARRCGSNDSPTAATTAP